MLSASARSTRAEPRRLRARELPVRPLPVPGAARPRGRRVRGRRARSWTDRRAHAPRPDQPRPLQVRRDPGRRADRPARARGRRARDPRLLPVGGDRPARRRPRSGSTSPSAARSSGCAAGPATAGCTCGRTWRSARADIHRLAATSTRSRSSRRWHTPPAVALPHGDAEHRRPLSAGPARQPLIEEIGVGRIRENSLRQTLAPRSTSWTQPGFGVYSPREPARRGGAVIVSVPEAAAVYAELEARGILGDFRP